MFSISLHQVVNDMVEHHLLNEDGRDNEALHFHLDLRMSYYRANMDHAVSRGLHLLYHCPKGFRSVSVFSGVTSSPFARIKEVEKWKHEGTHDSCWRQVQTISQLYFEMAEEVISHFDKSLKLCANDLHEHNSFAMFGELFEWVPAEVKNDPEDRNNYRRVIVLR